MNIMDTTVRATPPQKNPIEALSKDEIINKYKGLLNIAKKAKQAKDELMEENRQLKETLAKASSKQNTLATMEEMVQEFTEKNLALTEQIVALHKKSQVDGERLAELENENESLKRQLCRMTDENDGLLANIDRMEQAMQQVTMLGNEQRSNLELLEGDIAKLKEAEAQNISLKKQIALTAEETEHRAIELTQLQQKYQNVKDLNSEQRKKFNSLKDRFIDVHRKLKNLKECKFVLLETQHEYAASVSKWQQEIIKASQQLCAKMTALQQENEELRSQKISSMYNISQSEDYKGLKITQLLNKVLEMERLVELLKKQKIKQPMEEQLIIKTAVNNNENGVNSTDQKEEVSKLIQMEQVQQELQQRLQIKDQEVIASSALRMEMEALKVAHEELQKHLTAVRTENQKIKSKSKNMSVLNLEIEAAEKSLAEVSAKLSAKSGELDAANERLATKENTNIQLRKEIDILEAAKNSETTHAKQLKEQIDRMQSQLKDAVHNQQQALTQNKELEQSIEKYKMQLEELQIQQTTNAQKQQSLLEESEKKASNSVQELQARVDTISDLENALQNAQRAHEELRNEYQDYKLKAQAVLRKNQNKDNDKTDELEAEVSALRSSEQRLLESNADQTTRLNKLEKQLELLQEDNSTLQRRSKELTSVIEELRQDNEALAQDNHRQLQQQQEHLQQQRNQIEQMDDSHKLQIRQLQEQLEHAKQTLQVTAKAQANSTTILPLTSAAVSDHHSLLNSAEQNKIDYLLMEHDSTANCSDERLAHLAAERKISTTSRRSLDFMPLDELLNTSMNAINSDTVTTISNFGRSVSLQDEDAESDGRSEFAALQQTQQTLQATKESLSIQESRVRHLTALLAENEQDLAKLTQMNDMLKEELRRQERSEEREQHMHNSEYLKNVFLKFLTLHNGDERMRLVPVLNTILRLSRSEAELLNCVAKGQKLTNDGGLRSWTGFLSAWSAGASNNNTNNSN